MSRSYNNNIPTIYTSILYIFGLLLFLEWLYPVEKVTDTTNLSVFIIYTLFCFIITILQVKWWISALLKGFGLLFIINGLFSEFSLISRLWFEQLFTMIGVNFQALFSQEWNDLTGMFRSILFLIIIWLMSYLIHYWFIQMKRIFIFVLLTIVYLAVLDTFTIYDASIPIVRTFALAFLGLGMANFFKEIQMERISFSWTNKNTVWMIPLILIVLFSTVIGYAAPKFEPQWPDPVPFIKNAAGGSGGGNGAIQKVGYGEDDSRLGGSFVQDYSPVFQAVAKKDHYWRIESKDLYTGKGWLHSNEPDYVEQNNGNILLEDYGADVETERLEAILDFEENTNIPKLVYPYGTNKVEADGNAMFLLNHLSGEISTKSANKDVALTDYTILYDYPSFPLDKMREDIDFGGDKKDQYTQLPSTLPDRVGQLAEEITSSFTTQYDKVKAIENYFGRNGFVYQTTDVPVPSDDQDYVDQFLFDSKVGYCDNFSTSMVVLLRTLDIPARWVKGFTSGEQIEDYVNGDSSYNVYEVTNSNAHSWVEVYFPEVGWVPFEPTQGFTNLTDFYSDTNTENADDALEAPTPELEESEEPDPKDLEKDEAVEAINQDNASGGSDGFTLNWWQIVIGGVILIIIAIVIYRKRFHLRSYLLERKWLKNQDPEAYQDAYHFVLKLLKHQGFSRNPDQTLREYAKRIDSWYSTDSMRRLTNEYEKIIYKNELDSYTVTEMKDLWKNFIKQILG
ncbi:transglutaminase domain-containing protein [Ornithinibacillus salinisoli]|uniref:Transglutaminase domain-containing protein n=1 Tax=Ornithinibacillus salinisoli TaxID=1848459 RepID=A0ABW4W791_9BACI